MNDEDSIKLPAELRDADDQVVSRGRVEPFDDSTGFHFYPDDSTPMDTIRHRAKTLLLTESHRKLRIATNPEICGVCEEAPRFHLKVT